MAVPCAIREGPGPNEAIVEGDQKATARTIALSRHPTRPLKTLSARLLLGSWARGFLHSISRRPPCGLRALCCGVERNKGEAGQEGIL
jgi:hypothetical protein